MILTRPSFRKSFAGLTPSEQESVAEAVSRLPDAFGRPHVHSGLGIRPFGPFFECRAGLKLRILFLPHQGDLVLVTVGSHDQIRRFIKRQA